MTHNTQCCKFTCYNGRAPSQRRRPRVPYSQIPLTCPHAEKRIVEDES